MLKESSYLRIFSLRQVMLLLTALIIVIVVIFALLSYKHLQKQVANSRLQQSYEFLNISSHSLSQELSFYNDLLESYAMDTMVRDAIVFDNEASALKWSNQVRAVLPQSLGAALFTSEGKILDEAFAQSIGNSCITDLQHRTKDTNIRTIPVHTDVPSLAHFDLTAPVMDETNNVIGLVFVSFSLQKLKESVELLANSNSAIALTDGKEGEILVASNNWGSINDPVEFDKKITNTNWHLKAQLKPGDMASALPVIGSLIIAGGALVVMLMLVLHRILVHNYFNVVDDIKDVVKRISNGELVDVQEATSKNQFFTLGVELSDELKTLSHRHKALHIESQTDALTGLANRRLFDHSLKYIVHNHKLENKTFCIVLIDLDNFKEINDRYGHVCGDNVLRALASAMRRVERVNDLASRWGGDEFAALLPEMTEQHVEVWVDRLRHAFHSFQRKIDGLPFEDYCKISCGITCISPGDKRDTVRLLHDADISLYNDKKSHNTNAQQQA